MESSSSIVLKEPFKAMPWAISPQRISAKTIPPGLRDISRKDCRTAWKVFGVTRRTPEEFSFFQKMEPHGQSPWYPGYPDSPLEIAQRFQG